MTQSKLKQIDMICKLDENYENRREELLELTMLDILNIKMEIKKNLNKNRLDYSYDEDDYSSRHLVNRIGCEN